MIRWFVDKNSKIPLYLQLKDLIKYYISTGAIQAQSQLPGVNSLSKELGVNFETVRKAYKELEREGLLSIRRGHGTHIMLQNVPQTYSEAPADPEAVLLVSAKTTIRAFLQQGKPVEEVERLMQQALAEASAERARHEIIFTECNTLQVGEISKLLENYLSRPVRPVLLKELQSELRKISPDSGFAPTVITTGFHINEVRETTKNIPINIHVLITYMSLETKRKLEGFGTNARFGFICRDEESIRLYKDVLKVELENPSLSLTCAISSETSKVKAMFKSVDVLLVSPPVYEEIKNIAPHRMPVFNLFDQVAPMSLRIIKESILADEGGSN